MLKTTAKTAMKARKDCHSIRFSRRRAISTHDKAAETVETKVERREILFIFLSPD